MLRNAERAMMSTVKTVFFNHVKTWFLKNKAQDVIDCSDLISRYANENYFGRMVKNSEHNPTIVAREIHEVIDFPLHWDYESYEGFYFNALGTDLSRQEFERLKLVFASLLGEPDEVFTYFDLDEPTWSSSNCSLQLSHIDTQGGGYERLVLKIDKAELNK